MIKTDRQEWSIFQNLTSKFWQISRQTGLLIDGMWWNLGKGVNCIWYKYLTYHILFLEKLLKLLSIMYLINLQHTEDHISSTV